MSDFIHDPQPMTVVVQNPSTGANEPTKVVNSDFAHRNPEQTSEEAALKNEQAKALAELRVKQYEDNQKTVEGDTLLGEEYIKARDENEGVVVIPEPPKLVTSRPATKEELDAVEPYRASTPEGEKVAVDAILEKKQITEKQRDQWHSEIDKLAKEVPVGETGEGQAVAVEDEGQYVSPPPFTQVNDKDLSETKTDDKVTLAKDVKKDESPNPVPTGKDKVEADKEDKANRRK